MADTRRRTLPSALRFEVLVLLYVAVLTGYIVVTRSGAAGTEGGLAIAPLVDLVYHRRIHWWSGVALLLVAAALLLAAILLLAAVRFRR